MPISPHSLRKLQEALGAEAADDLVSRLEGMDAIRGDIRELRHEMELGFARVEARFQQVDARFAQVDVRFEQLHANWIGRFEQLDAKWIGRFEQLDAKWTGRFEQLDAKWTGRFDQLDAKWTGRFDTGQARMEVLMEKGLREQTRFFFLAWSVLLAAIVGLYAR